MRHTLDDASREALSALLGARGLHAHTRSLDLDLRTGAIEAQGLSLQVDGRSSDFVMIDTDWRTSAAGTDFHLLDIRRGETPDVPRTGAAIGPCGTIRMTAHDAPVIAIDILAYAMREDGIAYDHGLALRTADGEAVTIATDHDSILGALTITRGAAAVFDDGAEALSIRETLR